jgi:hypothetical protein
MNIFKNIQKPLVYISLICISGLVGCQDFLTESNPSNRTTDNYYKTAAGYESLVASCYPLLRDLEQSGGRMLEQSGTDIFEANGNGLLYFNQPNPIGSQYDVYDNNRLNASCPELQSFWDLVYREANRCNAVIDRSAEVTGMTDSIVKLKVAEAKFLRSFVYFKAVQQWGDIPMPLTETTSASLAVTKTPASEVYTQIITDLQACVSTLPTVQKDQGRPTKGAAKFLLARVYLTRGWNFNNSLGGTSADFTSALQLCDDLISSGLYPLESNWNNLWPIHNTNPNKETASATTSVATANASKEVIWAIQYANALAYAGDPTNSSVLLFGGSALLGNNLHEIISGGPSLIAQQARNTLYNRWAPSQYCTWAAYRMFDTDNDVRYKGTFNSVCYATTAGSVSLATNNPYPQALTLTYAVNDTTAIAMPWNHPVTDPTKFGVDIPGGTKHYSVINPNQYFGLGYINGGPNPIVDLLAWKAPMFWKFFQPGIQYGDGYSTFNDPIFRSAELYLMAAEAIVKGATGAKLGTADVYYNVVLDRALGSKAGSSPQCAANLANPDDITNLVSYRATPSTITVDLILDERARELMGEGNQRWYDLKRTATLISRTTKYNPWTAYGTSGKALIDAHNYLRPIPQGMLDNSNPRIPQNPGY